MERYAVECDVGNVSDGAVSDGAESNQHTGDCTAGVAVERCAMEGENGNVLDDAESMCQSVAGCIGSSAVVTTVSILVMNANVLLGKDPERLNDFRTLIGSRNPKPDIIVIQELGGTS